MIREYLNYIQESLQKGIEIREVPLNDWKKEMSLLFKQFNKDTKGHSAFKTRVSPTSDRNSMMGKSKNITLVASINGVDIGFIIGLIDLAKLDVGIIKYVWLHKDYRSQGIMDELFKRLIKWFTENKAPIIRVWTQGKNFRALKFYKKMGFDIETYGLRNLDSKNIKPSVM